MMLNKMCCEYDENFSMLVEECLRLTDYSVNVRYPYSFDLVEEDMNMAIKDAQKVQDFILQKFTGFSSGYKQKDGDNK